MGRLARTLGVSSSTYCVLSVSEVKTQEIAMPTTGRPFDVQEQIRIGGRSVALKILIKALVGNDAPKARREAERALAYIGHQVATEQPLPDCPEAYLMGMHDIEQALREAISLLGGPVPE